MHCCIPEFFASVFLKPSYLFFFVFAFFFAGISFSSQVFLILPSAKRWRSAYSLTMYSDCSCSCQEESESATQKFLKFILCIHEIRIIERSLKTSKPAQHGTAVHSNHVLWQNREPFGATQRLHPASTQGRY